MATMNSTRASAPPASARARWAPSKRWLFGLLGLALLGLGVRYATLPPANAGRALTDFSPERLGAQEQQLWEAYYYRQWPRLLGLLIQVSREQFGLSPAQALYAASVGTLAQIDWARNGASTGAAEAYMRDFYAYVKGPTGGQYDPARAAAKELRWWAVHRDAAHHTAGSAALEDAFTDLYVELYQRSPEAVRPAARVRAQAVALSDQWLDAGMPSDSPLLGQIREELIASYRALHQAVARP